MSGLSCLPARLFGHNISLGDAVFASPVTGHIVNWLPGWCRTELYPALHLPDEADGSGRHKAGGVEIDGQCASSHPLVRFADVGCGFGGLLVRLAPLYPDTLMVGMELRDKVRCVIPGGLGRCSSLHSYHGMSSLQSPLHTGWTTDAQQDMIRMSRQELDCVLLIISLKATRVQQGEIITQSMSISYPLPMSTSTVEKCSL